MNKNTLFKKGFKYFYILLIISIVFSCSVFAKSINKLIFKSGNIEQRFISDDKLVNCNTKESKSFSKKGVKVFYDIKELENKCHIHFDTVDSSYKFKFGEYSNDKEIEEHISCNYRKEDENNTVSNELCINIFNYNHKLGTYERYYSEDTELKKVKIFNYDGVVGNLKKINSENIKSLTLYLPDYNTEIIIDVTDYIGQTNDEYLIKIAENIVKQLKK